MSEQPTYRFVFPTECAMCGAEERRWRVLGRRLDRSQGWWPWGTAGAATTVVRCRRCDLVFCAPMPVPRRLTDHYDTTPAHYFGPERVVAEEGIFRFEIDRTRELLGPIERPRALDIGAGVGRVMAALDRAGFDVTGLEPSESFRDVALERFSIPPERLLLGSVQEASFAPGSFDFITFGAVLEHLPDPASSLERALSWLRPEGVIHIEVPSSKWLMGRMLNGYFRMIGSGLVTNLSPMHAPYHLFEFSLRSFRLHGKRAGYAVVDFRRFPGDPMVPGIAGRMLRRLMRLSGTGMQLAVWLRPGRVASIP